MNRIQSILDQMTEITKECREIIEKSKTATDEEKVDLIKVHKTKQCQFDKLKTDLETEKELKSQEDLVTKTRNEYKPDDSKITLKDEEPKKMKSNIDVSYHPVKDEMIKKDYFFKYLSNGPGGLEGEQFQAIRPAHYKMLSDHTCVALPKSMQRRITEQHPDKDVVYKADYNTISKAILSTDSSGAPGDSGAAALIPEDFRGELLAMPVAMPKLYDYVRVIRAQHGKAVWPKLDQDEGNFGGVAFTWSNEGAEKGETEPHFVNFEVETNELSGWTEVSTAALSRSGIELEAELTNLFRDAARQVFSAAIVRGTGNNMPVGIINDNDVNEVSRSFYQSGDTTSGEIVSWLDLTGLEYAVSQGNRSNGRFILDDTVERYLKMQIDTDARPIFTADVHSQIKNVLAGYPYSAHEFGPQLGTRGDIIFGNPRQYAFAMEDDIAIARSEHAEFKRGLVVFRLMAYVGGRPIHPSAFSVLSNSVV